MFTADSCILSVRDADPLALREMSAAVGEEFYSPQASTSELQCEARATVFATNSKEGDTNFCGEVQRSNSIYVDQDLSSDQELRITKDNETDNIENNQLPERAEQADSEKEEEIGFSKLVNFGKEIMFSEAALCVSDVLLMILGFCLRFSLSYTAREVLVNLVKCLAGPKFENWSFSKYMFSKLCDAPDYVITYNFFCTSCTKGLLHSISKQRFKKQSTECSSCGKAYELSLGSPNYFIGIDLEYQIKLLLTNVDVKKALLDYTKVIRENVEDGLNAIRDVYDGQLYRKIRELIRSDGTSLIITLRFNTDGAPLFHSSKKSFWPLQGFVNELPPEIRFQHSLLCALSVGDREPSAAQIQLKKSIVFLEVLQIKQSGRHRSGWSGCCFIVSVFRMYFTGPRIANRSQNWH